MLLGRMAHSASSFPPVSESIVPKNYRRVQIKVSFPRRAVLLLDTHALLT